MKYLVKADIWSKTCTKEHVFIDMEKWTLCRLSLSEYRGQRFDLGLAPTPEIRLHYTMGIRQF